MRNEAAALVEAAPRPPRTRPGLRPLAHQATSPCRRSTDPAASCRRPIAWVYPNVSRSSGASRVSKRIKSTCDASARTFIPARCSGRAMLPEGTYPTNRRRRLCRRPSSGSAGTARFEIRTRIPERCGCCHVFPMPLPRGHATGPSSQSPQPSELGPISSSRR